MRVSPASQSVAVGADVVVDIVVDNIVGPAGLAAYGFQLAFDGSVLGFASVTNAELFLESTGRTAQCFGPILADLADGLVTFGCASFGASPPGPTGSGVLARVTFTTSCDGFSSLDFTSVNLGEPLGASIPARTQGGSATVGGGGACPTATPSPTGAPVTPTTTPTATPTGPTATPVTPTPPVTATPVPQLCGSAPGVAICVLPVSQTVSSGDLVVLQIGVDNVNNLGGFQFDLVFNDLLLAGVEIEAGPFFTSTGRPSVCQALLAADGLGLLCVTLG